jgi:farnesyl-diphosphate farnesyltransferase
VRFGKGLQLVNILRDLPRDLRAGRCYVPADALLEVGLTPEDLLKPENEARFRPLYDSLLDVASEHLAAGWRYTCSTPANQRRLRLACAWPILIGNETLRRLRAGRVLDPATRIKAPKSRVRSILLRSVVTLAFRGTWERQFRPQ